jgi:hypothetical protein
MAQAPFRGAALAVRRFRMAYLLNSIQRGIDLC